MLKGRFWIPILTIGAVYAALFLRNWTTLHKIELLPSEVLVVLSAESAIRTDDVNVPDVPGAAFVHVGKTGGSSITRYLRNACHSYFPKPCGGKLPPNETLISRRITDYYHVPDFFRLPRQRHSFYLFSLRDPYDRTVSGFVLGHPDNAQVLGEGYEMWKRKRSGYFDAKCFETLEEFVQHIGDDHENYQYNYRPTEMVRDKNCTNFCRAMIHSKVKRMVHLFYGYSKLQSLLPNSTENTKLDHLTIYATRKEHLLEDFARINRLLGDATPFLADTHVRDVSNVTLPVKRNLSEGGRNRLCKALEEEYRIYMEFLLHAQNLSREDVVQSLLYSQTKCPNLEVLSLEHWNERLESKTRQQAA